MFTCAVYYQRERFSLDGCKSSYEANLTYDPYPFGVVLSSGLILRWPILKCKKDKWKAQGFENCGFYLLNRTVQDLIKKKQIFIHEDGQLCDFVSKELAVIPQKYWRGECKRCGRCCLGESGIHRCKYLRGGEI